MNKRIVSISNFDIYFLTSNYNNKLTNYKIENKERDIFLYQIEIDDIHE